MAEYNLAHRGTLLAGEVAVGLALLAFIGFLATLVPVIWRAGQEPLEEPPNRSLTCGVGLFIVWMLVLSAGLWHTAASGTSPTPVVGSLRRFIEGVRDVGSQWILSCLPSMSVGRSKTPAGVSSTVVGVTR